MILRHIEIDEPKQISLQAETYRSFDLLRKSQDAETEEERAAYERAFRYKVVEILRYRFQLQQSNLLGELQREDIAAENWNPRDVYWDDQFKELRAMAVDVDWAIACYEKALAKCAELTPIFAAWIGRAAKNKPKVEQRYVDLKLIAPHL